MSRSQYCAFLPFVAGGGVQGSSIQGIAWGEWGRGTARLRRGAAAAGRAERGTRKAEGEAAFLLPLTAWWSEERAGPRTSLAASHRATPRSSSSVGGRGLPPGEGGAASRAGPASGLAGALTDPPGGGALACWRLGGGCYGGRFRRRACHGTRRVAQRLARFIRIAVWRRNPRAV